MQMIADILLGAGALGAAFYCLVLSRRLKKFTRLENGMGGAIAVLSAQVDQMTKVLEAAQAAARHSADTLEAKTARGEKVAERLELILAAMHDLPTSDAKVRGAAKSGKSASTTLSKGGAPSVVSGMKAAEPVNDGLVAESGADEQSKAAKSAADGPATRARFVRRRVSRNDSEAA